MPTPTPRRSTKVARKRQAWKAKTDDNRVENERSHKKNAKRSAGTPKTPTSVENKQIILKERISVDLPLMHHVRYSPRVEKHRNEVVRVRKEVAASTIQRAFKKHATFNRCFLGNDTSEASLYSSRSDFCCIQFDGDTPIIVQNEADMIRSQVLPAEESSEVTEEEGAKEGEHQKAPSLNDRVLQLEQSVDMLLQGQERLYSENSSLHDKVRFLEQALLQHGIQYLSPENGALQRKSSETAIDVESVASTNLLSPKPRRVQKGWEIRFDPDTGHDYYFNPTTGISTWETPDELKEEEEKAGPVDQVHKSLKQTKKEKDDELARYKMQLEQSERESSTLKLIQTELELRRERETDQLEALKKKLNELEEKEAQHAQREREIEQANIEQKKRIELLQHQLQTQSVEVEQFKESTLSHPTTQGNPPIHVEGQDASGPSQEQDDEEAQAIVRLQSAFRSHKARDKVRQQRAKKFSKHSSGWTKHHDPHSGVNYYYNLDTGESRWTEPEDFVDPDASSNAKAEEHHDQVYDLSHNHQIKEGRQGSAFSEHRSIISNHYESEPIPEPTESHYESAHHPASEVVLSHYESAFEEAAHRDPAEGYEFGAASESKSQGSLSQQGDAYSAFQEHSQVTQSHGTAGAQVVETVPHVVEEEQVASHYESEYHSHIEGSDQPLVYESEHRSQVEEEANIYSEGPAASHYESEYHTHAEEVTGEQAAASNYDAHVEESHQISEAPVVSYHESEHQAYHSLVEEDAASARRGSFAEHEQASDHARAAQHEEEGLWGVEATPEKEGDLWGDGEDYWGTDTGQNTWGEKESNPKSESDLQFGDADQFGGELELTGSDGINSTGGDGLFDGMKLSSSESGGENGASASTPDGAVDPFADFLNEPFGNEEAIDESVGNVESWGHEDLDGFGDGDFDFGSIASSSTTNSKKERVEPEAVQPKIARSPSLLSRRSGTPTSRTKASFSLEINTDEVPEEESLTTGRGSVVSSWAQGLTTPTGRQAGEWVERVDGQSGEVYFYNTTSGESRWDPPDDFLRRAGVKKPATSHVSWEYFTTPAGSGLFWYDWATGTSQKDRPDEVGSRRGQELAVHDTVPAASGVGPGKYDRLWEIVRANSTPVEHCGEDWVLLEESVSKERFYCNHSAHTYQWSPPQEWDESCATAMETFDGSSSFAEKNFKTISIAKVIAKRLREKRLKRTWSCIVTPTNKCLFEFNWFSGDVRKTLNISASQVNAARRCTLQNTEHEDTVGATRHLWIVLRERAVKTGKQCSEWIEYLDEQSRELFYGTHDKLGWQWEKPLTIS